MTERIGFIGLGIMGRGMARNLLGSGHELTVWNRTASRMKEIDGAAAASTIAELTGKCTIIFLCVSDTPDVEEVLYGDNGVYSSIAKGALVVDHSTISPQKTREFATRLAEKGASMIDAPVSGGSEGAERGTLSIMVGGKESDFQRALPFMKSYGKSITHVGEIGAGQMAKLVNQVLVVGNTLAMSEALLLAKSGGLDLEKTLQAVSGGAAGSWMLSNRGPQILDRDFRPGFTIDLQQKDLRLALEAADQTGIPLPGTALIYQLYRTLQKAGLGAEGNHGLIKALERLSGETVVKE